MKFAVLITGITLLLSSCRDNSGDRNELPPRINERLTEMNARRVEMESKKIDQFIEHRQYRMNKTGTGLRFEIYEHGTGNHPVLNDEVEVVYKVCLLDDSLCESTHNPEVFRIGTGQETRGLEEGLLLMTAGDKARLIVPSHLAYGLSGDGDKIPPASALYYEVDLLSVKK